MLLGGTSTKNVECLRGILRLFEIVFGLKINFHKSSINGINVHKRRVEGFADVLRYKIGKISFSYLGLPIGANFKNKEVWKPLVDRFRKKLSGCKRRYLSFGGRLVLLNSVLSALSIYYLSFKSP